MSVHGCFLIRASALALAFGATSPLPAQRTPRADSLQRRDSIARLAAVTVVATAAERAAPAGSAHIDGASIRSFPATTPYELLRQSAGLEVHEQGQGPGFASDASLRGFSSDHSTDLALWVDGVPVNEPVNGHAEGYGDWSVLFPGGVQDIDVHRGPTSALFGNFALAGVVNVRTVERMRGAEVTLASGSFGRRGLMLLGGFDHGRDGGGVIGVDVQHEDGFRPHGGHDLVHGHARLVRAVGDGVTFDGGVDVYGARWNSPGYLGEDAFARGAYETVTNESDAGFKRRAQERLSVRVARGTYLWRTTAYATQGRWQLFLTVPPAGGRFEGTGGQTEEEDARAGAGLTSALTRALPRGELTVGGESRWDHASYENYRATDRRRDSTVVQVRGHQAAGSLFAAAHSDVGDRVRLDAGFRMDLLSTRSAADSAVAQGATHAVLSPKLGAIVRVSPGVALYGNLSRGFRSANGVLVDPSLEPITAWAYEGGAKLDAGAASASVALFRMRVSNEQTFNPVTLSATSGGASQRQGMELDWDVPVASAVTVSGNWTLNDARYTSLTAVEESSGEAVVLDGRRVYNTARYVGRSSVVVAPGGARWRVMAGGNWVGQYSPFDEPGESIGDYGLAHVSTTVRVAGLEVGVGVRNLFDRRYPELVAGHLVAPGQPRTLSISLRTRL